MKDINRPVTVYIHELFGEIRTVKDDDGKMLFVSTDIANCLQYKNVKKRIKNRCREEFPVKINCVSAINSDGLVLDEKIINTIYMGDVLALIDSSKRSDARLFELWLRRDVLTEDIEWSKDFLFNREFFKDEYINLQLSEKKLLRAKIYLLEKEILKTSSLYAVDDKDDERCKDKELYSKNKKIKTITSYEHPLFGEVKTVTREGEILFVANDIAKCLKYSRPQEAVKYHCANIVKTPIYCEIKVSENGDTWDRRTVNTIPMSDTMNLISFSSKVDKRMFELWVRKEILGEENESDKYQIYHGEFYKDEYIKVMSQKLNIYREQIKILEKELFNKINKIPIDNPDLITNYNEDSY